MAQIELVFRATNGTVIAQAEWKVSAANATRILNAEKINLSVETVQEVCEKLLDRAVKEWIGDTRTIEKNAAVVAEIPRE